MIWLMMPTRVVLKMGLIMIINRRFLMVFIVHLLWVSSSSSSSVFLVRLLRLYMLKINECFFIYIVAN